MCHCWTLSGSRTALSDLLGVRWIWFRGRALRLGYGVTRNARRYLPFKDPVQPLQDILENIGRIERFFLTGKDPLDVAEDERTLFASQYALLIISEAAKRLGDDAECLCPGQPWRDIRYIGNSSAACLRQSGCRPDLQGLSGVSAAVEAGGRCRAGGLAQNRSAVRNSHSERPIPGAELASLLRARVLARLRRLVAHVRCGVSSRLPP